MRNRVIRGVLVENWRIGHPLPAARDRRRVCRVCCVIGCLRVWAFEFYEVWLQTIA